MCIYGSSQVALVVKESHLSVKETQDMRVQSLGREDPLEEGMATHSSILAWEFHEHRSLEGYSL